MIQERGTQSLKEKGNETHNKQMYEPQAGGRKWGKKGGKKRFTKVKFVGVFKQMQSVSIILFLLSKV